MNNFGSSVTGLPFVRVSISNPQHINTVDNAANDGHPRQFGEMLDYHEMMDPELEAIEAPREKNEPWGLVDFLLCGCDHDMRPRRSLRRRAL